MKTLYHLTVNTRNAARTRRDEVDQTVIDKLLPLIDNEAGEFRGLNMAFDLYRPLDQSNGNRPVNGGAIFRIGPDATSPMPYAICFACWKADLSEDTWQQCREANEEMAPALKTVRLYEPVGDTPPPVPWLAVILLPTIALLDPDRSGMMGDMERCLFWALAEGSK